LVSPAIEIFKNPSMVIIKNNLSSVRIYSPIN
jgi:hypothetical protein